MSKEKTKSFAELTQELSLIANNPGILAKNPNMIMEIVGKLSQEMEISYVSFKPSRQDAGQVNKQLGEQVDAICGKVRGEVLEQIRSEISGIFGTTRGQFSARSMMQAMSETIRRISLIREVRAIHALAEPESLRFIVVHDSADRIETLRKVAEVENWLDSNFEDLFFEFEVLHHSEVNEDLTRDALLIFERI